MLVILTTTPTQKEAESLAGKIVENRLAGCVQILSGLTSVYAWEGAIQRESEHLLLIKTLEEKYPELEAFISEHHSYQVPEIVALNSEQVSGTYLQWLEKYITS